MRDIADKVLNKAPIYNFTLKLESYLLGKSLYSIGESNSQQG